MRTLVYNTISSVLNTYTGGRIYPQGALGFGPVPASPNKPFVIFTELVTGPYQEVKETSDAEVIPYQVYLYVERGSHLELTERLRKLRDPILALPGQISSTGARCLGTTWGGISQDFMDTEFDANVRFASFTVTGSNHREA